MKKFLKIFIVLVLLAAVAAGLWWYTQESPEQVRIEQVLPAGPLVYGRSTNVQEHVSLFTKTEFWQKIRAVDFRSILKELGFEEERLVELDALAARLQAPETQKLARFLFGQEIAYAVYPRDVVNFEMTRPEDVGQVLSGFSIVTRLGADVKFAEALAMLVDRFSEKINIERRDYQERMIYLATIKDFPIPVGFTVIDDILVLGLTESAAQSAIDAYTENLQALEEDDGYLAVKKDFYPQTASMMYVDTERILQLAQEYLNAVLEKQEDEELRLAIRRNIEDALQQAGWMRAIGYSSRVTDVIESKMRVYIHSDELDPDIRDFYQMAPRSNDTLAFVPQDVLGYQWGVVDFGLMWSQWKKGIARAADADPQTHLTPDQVVAGLEKQLNLDVNEDILPALGDEAGGFVQKIEVTPLFPVPQMVLFLKSGDKAKAQQLLDRLVTLQSFLRPQTEAYHDFNLQYFRLPLIQQVQPAFMMLNGYLLFSTHVDLLKQTVDVMRGEGKPLAADPIFVNEDFRLAANNHSVFFLRTARLFQNAGSLLEWGNDWVDAQKAKQSAFVAGSEQRLQDLKQAIGEDRLNLSAMQKELAALESEIAANPGDPSLVMKEQIDDLKRNIDRQQSIITDKESSIADLQLFVSQYEGSQSVESEQRKMLVEKVGRPLMDAFASVLYVTSRSVFGEEVLETVTTWKIK